MFKFLVSFPRKYLLEIIVFICGADVMVLEMVGSRVLAPYVGTSIFVWTSLIGVILGCLSYGYYKGGKIADKSPNFKTFSIIILLSAVSVGAIGLVKENLLSYLRATLLDIRIEAIVGTLLLFGPASVLLGMVTPFASKLRLSKLENSGTTVGTLYAVSTIGSITGTFLAGFYLISFFGNTQILWLISLSLLITSIILSVQDKLLIKLGLIAVILLFSLFGSGLNTSLAGSGLIDVDTQYSRVWIFTAQKGQEGKPIRVMRINNETSSAKYVGSDTLVFDYTKFYRLVGYFKPDLKESLMIGGGAYSYPRDYLNSFTQAKLDVVEIDPQITELAQKYFGLKKDPRLSIYHEDGRTFLNRNTKKYDAIFMDAYRSIVIPHQLTTKEAIKHIYDGLNDNGVVLANIISTVDGSKGRFLRSEYATYKSIFPQVYIFPVETNSNGTQLQNIILVALKSKEKPSFESEDAELKKYLANLWTKEIKTDLPVLTDEYAPVDFYRMDTL